jgi:hypothetical protein
MTSIKSRVKPTTSQLQTHEKNVTKNKLPVTSITNPSVVGVQRSSNCHVTQEEALVLPGTCNYRNSNYENSHDWISPVFSSSDQIVERIPATHDRINPISDLHLGNMERNVKRYSLYFTLIIIIH